jgi:endonuclease-3
MTARMAAKKIAKTDDPLPKNAVARGRFRLQKPEEIKATFAELRRMYPDAHCALHHASAFQLLVATVLSAQTTDIAVNKATPKLFSRFPDARAMSKADPHELETLVGTLGFFRQKARSILGLSKRLVEAYGGEVPPSMPELLTLPGVGRKTANVVLGVAFHAPEGIVVDTHVQRISQRLGWTKAKDPDKIEIDLCKKLPRADWDLTAHLLIFHGRQICFAAKPLCGECKVNALCPSAFRAEKIGRKPVRKRPG